MPECAYLVGYVDDIMAIIMARNVEQTKRKVIIRTNSWLVGKGLKFSTEKTKLILLPRMCMPLEIGITTCDTTLATRKVVNNRGIRLAPRLTF